MQHVEVLAEGQEEVPAGGQEEVLGEDVVNNFTIVCFILNYFDTMDDPIEKVHLRI